jgi:UDP-N-acetylglucosamine:LPS N-acetylglucosamine transferase
MSSSIELFAGTTPKTILFSPLDWGLGHATRCIPLIKEAINAGHRVIIAADNGPYALLKSEFPSLEFIRLEGYEIKYPPNGNMIFSMAVQLPRLVRKIILEFFKIKKIVSNHKIDWVISDNRYGLFGHQAKAIFITHQIHIKTGIFEFFFNSINRWFIERYDECWIPDKESQQNLGGELSHPTLLPRNTLYIGPISRFESRKALRENIELLILLSGPEPQRTLFENLIIQQLQHFSESVVMVRGLPLEANKLVLNGNLKVYNHLPDSELNQLLIQSRIVLSRSGYSTIMDLMALKKKAVFIPTPGQTEQEYLATRFKKMNIAPFQKQSEFNLKELLMEAKSYQGFSGW